MARIPFAGAGRLDGWLEEGGRMEKAYDKVNRVSEPTRELIISKKGYLSYSEIDH